MPTMSLDILIHSRLCKHWCWQCNKKSLSELITPILILTMKWRGLILTSTKQSYFTYIPMIILRSKYYWWFDLTVWIAKAWLVWGRPGKMLLGLGRLITHHWWRKKKMLSIWNDCISLTKLNNRNLKIYRLSQRLKF